ncbi:MAG TPA: RNA-binding cell elongation regulator Jag/EloR [Anaerolineae bacterium]|nr:RNA-binding cell elongation regulator Jag/EloR [Anaerolineae bacterium]
MDVPQSIEAVGNTIEDAIARGLEALNAERRNVEIEVLTTTAREARVRLTVKARSERPTVEATPASASGTPAAAPDDDTATAQRVLAALLDNMQLKAEVDARQAELLSDRDRQDGPTLVLNIRGGDLGTLIGRRGETLEDLQYLTRLLVAKELGRYINLVLDVEGYKSHREQMLQQLAQRMAERVVTSHKPASLEPMPANERRIIHLTLRDHPQVRTESIGSGEDRKVTIVPKSAKH